MKKFTKSISSIIMLCLLLAGNNVYSKSNPFFEKTNHKTGINNNIDANIIKFVPPATPVISGLVRGALNITFITPTNILATTYLVERKANNGLFGSIAFARVTDGANQLFTDSFTPVAGVSYTYRIKAVNIGLEASGYSNELLSCNIIKPIISGFTLNSTLPPLGVTLTTSDIQTGYTYELYRRPSGGAFVLVATDPTWPYFDPFVTSPGVTYQYQLRGINSSGIGPLLCDSFSDIKDVVVSSLITPIINSVTPVSAFQLNVDWVQTLPPGISRWYLERGIGGAGFVAVGDFGPTERFKEDGRNAPKLLPNTNYCYRVKFTTNGGFTSPWSLNKCNTTPQLPLLTNLSATANNCSRITLNWVEPSAAVLNESNYKIYRAEGAGAMTLLAQTGNNISSYEDDNLKPNTNYSYQVSAIYESTETPRSSTASATTKPSILTLLNNSATTANIQWDKCTPFSQGWKVYVSTNDGPFVEKVQVGPQEDKYSFTGLLPQTKYAVYVLNIFGTGLGGPTNTVVFTTPKFPGPTNLNAFPNGSTSIKVTWQDNSNGPDNEEAFIVYRSIDNGVTFTAINRPPLLTEYIDNDNLKPSQKVCYYVTARHATGFSDASNTKCEATCPSPLTEFTKVTAVSTTQIDLEWASTENFGPTTITIEESLDGITFSKLADVAGTTTSYKDLTATPNQKKYYRANVKNEGSCSSIYSLIGSTTSCPLAPTNIVAKSISSNSVEVKWDLGVKIKTYIIERSTDNIDFVKAGEVEGTLAVFVDKNLQSSKKYYYRVIAVNEGCSSAASQVKQESTATTCPAPPSNLVAVANSAKEIKITFTDNSPDELGFEVEWSKDGITFTKVGSNISPNGTTATISTGVDAETKYFFRVKALGELCNSNYSNIANVTTNPPAPTGLSAKGVKINQVDLAWTNTSKTATTIEVQRTTGADNNFVKLGSDLAVTLNSYQNTGLAPGTAFNYRIRYSSPNGFSDWSNVASGSTFVISANEDSDLAKQISLYPVPTENALYIKPGSTINGKVSTKIVNITGSTLITQDFNGFVEGKTEQINVTNLSSGIYFLEISTKKGSATKKFLKK